MDMYAAVPMVDVMNEVFEMIDSGGKRGIETGFFELDDILNGLQRGEMIVVAAGPSMGKTAFALNIVEHVAIDNRLPCAVFSLEMNRQRVAQRTLCSRGKIDQHTLRKGLLQSHDYAHLANVVTELAKAKIWIDDSPRLTISDVCDRSRRLREQHDIKLLLVDYIQLIRSRPRDTREQELADISREIKALARELDIPIICISQISRAGDRRYEIPRLGDVRGSGAIEEDADVVIFLHRPDFYRMSEPDFQPDNIAEVFVAKQRNGPTGSVKLTFLDKAMCFENLSALSDPFA